MEYLYFCQLYPPPNHRTIRSHLMKFLYRYFAKHPEIRNRLGDASTLEEYEVICQELGMILASHEDSEYDDIWYLRHQKEKENQAINPVADPKKDKLKFESLFERLAREARENGDGSGEGESAGGLFDGMGMFGGCECEEDRTLDAN